MIRLTRHSVLLLIVVLVFVAVHGCQRAGETVAATAPESISEFLPNAYAGEAYKAQLPAAHDGATRWYLQSALPSGLKFDGATGTFSGTTTQIGEYKLALQAQPGGQTRDLLLLVWPRLDRFGGLVNHPCPSGPARHFYTAKIDHRWVLCTPAGNQFWLLSVYKVDGDEHVDELGSSYSKRVAAKYGSTQGWAQAQINRLKAWGFNGLGPYSHYSLWGSFPSFQLAKNTPWSLENRMELAPGPTKDLFRGFNSRYYDASWGQFPDVFDPNFEIYWNKAMAANVPGIAIYSSPYLIGIATDDRDDLFGFGPGPELGGEHPNLGRLALLMSPTQLRSRNGTVYRDSKVYTKFALRDFLQARYKNDLARLNSAWNSSYTSWDSDGGWGKGNGLLDEDGRHRWTGKDATGLSDLTPAMARDLDEFLYQIARRYFFVTTTAIRKVLGKEKVLIFGPSTFNSNGLTFAPILRAAGEYCDVVQASVEAGPIAVQRTYQYTGHKPLVTWEGLAANADSALWRNPVERASWTASTQAERGQLYTRNALDRFNARDAATGDYPVIGIAYWEFHDNYGERRNFGLVSLSDNAYDGKEAATGTHACQWPLENYLCGREERSYGDFLGASRRANLRILQSLASEMKP